MTIAVSHGGGATVLTADAPSEEALVGTVDGVVRIVRGAAGWTAAERTLEGKHVHALAQDPKSGVWFCGVERGGIYASEDDGHTWEKRDFGVTQPNVYSISVAETDGQTLVFAGTEPAHLFVSDDLGLTWTEKPALHAQETDAWRFPAPPHVAHLKHISFHPNDSRVVYASIEQGGLYRSDDGGDAFAEIPGMYNDVHRLVSNPAQPERMFVTGGMGLWLSRDAGATWDNVFSRGSAFGGYPDQLVYKPSDPSSMLVTSGQESPGAWHRNGTAETRISRSRDAGETWEVVSAPGLEDKFAASVEAMTLEEAGGSAQVFAATSHGEILWSEDGGDNWTIAVSGLPAVSKGNHYHAFASDPRR